MINDFHLLRPWWLLICLPLFILIVCLWRRSAQQSVWDKECDAHLLQYLMETTKPSPHHRALFLLLLSGLCMSLSLAGPAWIRLPVPTYQTIQPRVIVLDLSSTMLDKDIKPDRLSRAKFKLHDLFQKRDIGQLGLIVYSGEPFVVSPLTDDAQTIDALLTSLSPDIMPLEGQHLENALVEAKNLIKQAGFNQGQILVLTAEAPSLAAIDVARDLASQQIMTSVLPMTTQEKLNPLLKRLAQSGKGQLLSLTDTPADIESWLQHSSPQQKPYRQKQEDHVVLWRDEGRWFLVPALLFLCPVFWRGWLQRV